MYNQKTVAAVVVGAGRSARMGFDKLLYVWEGMEIVRRSVQCMDIHPFVDTIVLVAGENIDKVRQIFAKHPTQKPLQIIEGAACRAGSVQKGISLCKSEDIVAIHDAARPFVPQEVVSHAIQAAAQMGAAAPALPVQDTVKRVKGDIVHSTPPRHELMAVQTPQVFNRVIFADAMEQMDTATLEQLTDDCMVMELAGHPVQLVEGSAANIKITTKADLPLDGEDKMPSFKIGHGYDVHKLVKDRPLIIGGVTIPYEMGLLGHSDADVLLHAVSDALLGASALGDIGKHFPDTGDDFKGADSMVLLQEVVRMVRQQGYSIGNIDATILCQKPKLAPHISAMRANIAKASGVKLEDVSVKATTEEGLGFTGEGLGIAAHCVVLLSRA